MSDDYQCGYQVPSECSNNPWITVSKGITNYKLEMKVCSDNNQCINLMDKRWKCKKICDVCSSIPAQTGKSQKIHNILLNYYLLNPNHIGCTSDIACERRVDAFVNSQCASITSTTQITTKTVSGPTVTHSETIYETLTGPTVTTRTTITESESCPVTTTATYSAQRTLVQSVTTVQPSCPIPTVDTTVTSTSTTIIYETKTVSGTTETIVLVKRIITIQPLCTALPNTAEKATSDVNVGVNLQSSLQKMTASSQNKPTVILGALLGLFVLVIVVMIIGWVWTYRSFKLRSQKVKSSVSKG